MYTRSVWPLHSQSKPHSSRSSRAPLHCACRSPPARDVGIDAKYGVTGGLNLDLTYNTDFAQVEVDEQQVNLTRFSLFFPEKRDFFLENGGFFKMGTGGTFTNATVETDLFFSRRIGLSDAGQPIPIVGGGRLAGKSGRHNIGVLDIQTDSAFGRPDDNFLIFLANLAIVRVDFAMTPRATIRSLTQYNSLTSEVTNSVRFNFMTVPAATSASSTATCSRPGCRKGRSCRPTASSRQDELLARAVGAVPAEDRLTRSQ